MLIVGLAIFSHSLIPHTHHYNLADEYHNDKDNESTHCHFLNLITIDKAIQKTFNQKITIQPILLVVLYHLNFEEKLNELSYFIKSDSKSNLLTFISTSPTRGSPSFS